MTSTDRRPALDLFVGQNILQGLQNEREVQLRQGRFLVGDGKVEGLVFRARKGDPDDFGLHGEQ